MTGAGLRAVEFFSGIGGLHYALLQASPGAIVVQAYDLNPTANEVYYHNFGVRPKQVNIEKVTKDEVDSLRASIWLLSPPCQPFTVRGLRRDMSDARTRGFLKLLALLGQLVHRPQYIFIENVVGFHGSATHSFLLEILTMNNYLVEEYVLSPNDYLIPNSRPRYFCLAWRALSLEKPKMLIGQVKRNPPCLDLTALRLSRGWKPTLDAYIWEPNEEQDMPNGNCAKLAESQQYNPESCSKSAFSSALPEEGKSICAMQEQSSSVSCTSNSICGEAKEFSEDLSSEFHLPWVVLHAHADVIDVVSQYSTSCNCFTKSYTQYAKGTGSVLATANFDTQQWKVTQKRQLSYNEVPGDKKALAKEMYLLRLRYFTPREIANLHFFPEFFSFPESTTQRQKYRLLGNSLNVLVVADLLVFLLQKCKHFEEGC